MEFLTKGTVIAKEGILQQFAYILLDGDVSACKKLWKMDAKDNDERDIEKSGIM